MIDQKDDLRKANGTLDQRLTRALEAPPSVSVPEDFALRVMANLPARKALPTALATTHRIGWQVAVAALFVLIAAMLAVALRAHGNPALTVVEWTLAGEFILLTVWLALRPQALR